MAAFYEVFKDWENQLTPGYIPRFPDIPFPNKPNISDPRYMVELKQVSHITIELPKELFTMLTQSLAKFHQA